VNAQKTGRQLGDICLSFGAPDITPEEMFDAPAQATRYQLTVAIVTMMFVKYLVTEGTPTEEQKMMFTAMEDQFFDFLSELDRKEDGVLGTDFLRSREEIDLLCADLCITPEQFFESHFGYKLLYGILYPRWEREFWQDLRAGGDAAKENAEVSTMVFVVKRVNLHVWNVESDLRSIYREPFLRDYGVTESQLTRAFLKLNEALNPPKRETSRRASVAAKQGCFVATTVYADAFHPDVCLLRSFRHFILEKTAMGRTFSAWYYRNGEALSRSLIGRGWLAMLTRAGLSIFCSCLRVILQLSQDWAKSR